MKRVTFFPQAILGIAFSWGIPMASTAIHGELNVRVCLFFLMSVVWIIAYDTQYAMVDRRDDRNIGVKSTALFLGNWDRLAIGVLQSVSVILLLLLGNYSGFETPYLLAVTTVAGLFVYQQILIRARDETLCFKAFGNNTWVGFTIFVGVVAEQAQDRARAAVVRRLHARPCFYDRSFVCLEARPSRTRRSAL